MEGLFMLNVLILDDHIPAVNALQALIYQIDSSISIMHHTKEDMGFLYATQYLVDIFLIEIDISEGNGYNFAKNLRYIKKYEAAHIIFITANTSLKIDAYEILYCHSFLPKPLDHEVFKKSFLRAINYKTTQRNPHIFLESNNYTYKILLNNIVAIGVDNKKITFYDIAEGPKPFSAYKYPLQTVEDMLDNNFIRISKSFLVNIHYVNCIRNGEIELAGMETPLKISRFYMASIKNALKGGKK